MTTTMTAPAATTKPSPGPGRKPLGGIHRPSAPSFPPRRRSSPPTHSHPSVVRPFSHSHPYPHGHRPQPPPYSRSSGPGSQPPTPATARTAALRGWMLGKAYHSPGLPHSPATIEAVDVPEHVLQFIRKGFGMRVASRDGAVWELSNEQCLRWLRSPMKSAGVRPEAGSGSREDERDVAKGRGGDEGSESESASDSEKESERLQQKARERETGNEGSDAAQRRLDKLALHRTRAVGRRLQAVQRDPHDPHDPPSPSSPPTPLTPSHSPSPSPTVPRTAPLPSIRSLSPLSTVRSLTPPRHPQEGEREDEWARGRVTRGMGKRETRKAKAKPYERGISA